MMREKEAQKVVREIHNTRIRRILLIFQRMNSDALNAIINEKKKRNMTYDMSESILPDLQYNLYLYTTP